ncbi:MAG TPA: type VI secretion system tube protein Hcp [Verrucomicrobiae bacterium]|nr:type VI secretion system tube protein Hcp [Verrucomicrobiae bacterium]
MRRCRFIGLSCALLLAGFHPAAAQIFLRLDGVAGPVTNANGAGWMALESLQQGVGRTITSGGAGGGRTPSAPSFSEFTVTKLLDSGSPRLALLAAGGGGNTINSGAIDLFQLDSDQTRYLRINLTNILVSSYSVSSGGDVPTESVSLAPLVVSWNFTSYRDTSGLPKEYRFNRWNLATLVGNSGTNAPAFVSTGIRSASGVQLSWTAVAGKRYRIYAVTDLTKPFVVLTEITATAGGIRTYNITPSAPAMFYTVEEVLNGY